MFGCVTYVPGLYQRAMSQINKERRNIAPMFHFTAMKLSSMGQQ